MITSIALNELNRPALEGVLSHLWENKNWSVLRQVCVEPGIQHVFCKVLENVVVSASIQRSAFAKSDHRLPEAYANIDKDGLNNLRINVFDKLSANERDTFMASWWESISTASFDILKKTGFPVDFINEDWLSLNSMKSLSVAKSKSTRLWLSWRDSQEMPKWPKQKLEERWGAWNEFYDVPARGAAARWVARAPMPAEERELWLKKICDTPSSSRNEMAKWWETEMPVIVALGAGLKPEEVPVFPSINREFVMRLIQHTLISDKNKLEKTLPWIDAISNGTLAYSHALDNHHTSPEQLYWTMALLGEVKVLDALMVKGYKPRKELIDPHQFETRNPANKERADIQMPWLAALAWTNASLDERVAKVFIKAYPEMMKDSLNFCALQLNQSSKKHNYKDMTAKLECYKKVQKILLDLNLRFVIEESKPALNSSRIKV